MQTIRIFAVLTIASAAHAQSSNTLNLMPMPAKVVRADGVLRIRENFRGVISGASDPRLTEAIDGLVNRLAQQTGLPLDPKREGPATLTVSYQSKSPEVPKLGEDESYTLVVDPAGAKLTAPTLTGALRGLATVAQLVSVDGTSFYLPAVRIEDRPRFPWRGLMLDVSRHWMPMEVVLRNLDALAAVKMNVFHWHLSDDQGFRVESKGFPKLHELGSDGHFFTQEQVRQVIAYAAARGIRVIPEFDMPGHTTAWFVGYPQFASAPGPYQIERHWGIFKPVLDPSREEVYEFIDTLLGEMTALFPDPYFHIGGDEVLPDDWLKNPRIAAWAKEHNLQNGEAIQGYFTKRVEQLVRKHGKIMIGWDEVLRPGLDATSVIQSWRGQKSLAEAARKGYRGVLSAGYYLDHLKPAADHYAVDPMEGAGDLTPEQAARILGGETCMWVEYVNQESVDSRIWPRTAAIAERLWSPRDVTNRDSMYARLDAVSKQLDYMGLIHREHYRVAIERLATDGDADAVSTLGDAVESAGVQVRRDTHRYTSLVPLNRLVDAVPPESEEIRRLNQLAAKVSTAPGTSGFERAALRQEFIDWRDNHKRLLPFLKSNYLLTEVTPLSEDLSRTGSIGLEVLDAIEKGTAPSPQWIAERRNFLQNAERPKAEVVLAAPRTVLVLLDASAHLDPARASR